MQRYQFSPEEALARLDNGRKYCEPNAGFKEQLRIYYEAQMTDDLEDSTPYQRFLYRREIEMSRACEQAPDAEKIRFEDEHAQDHASAIELRCRKCRCANHGFDESLLELMDR